jgi:miniconductance mechanosensitive channel
MLTPYIQFLESVFQSLNLTDYYFKLLTQGTAFLSIVIGSMMFYFVAWFIINRTIIAMIHRSENDYDDILIKNKVISRASYLVPAYIINSLTPLSLPSFPNVAIFVQESIEVYVIIMVILTVIALINSGFQIYNSFEISKTKPIKGLVEVVKIVVYIIGSLMVIASLLDRSLGALFIGLGTLSAVLMLVFKDAILGFVGGVQLSLNDMVRLGDWISMPKFGADGEVLDITLTTVKVQNFDKTITTIPTYAMVSDYFTNWRGMTESGGRRIKRNISIDMESVHFCTPELLDYFKRFHLISDFISAKEAELASIDKQNFLNPDFLVNGNLLTNLGVFRVYLTAYLNNLPGVHKEMPVLVRHLQSTENGIPLELYLFSNRIEMNFYENLQSEIFDHILSVTPLFHLRIYQSTTSFKQQ